MVPRLGRILYAVSAMVTAGCAGTVDLSARSEYWDVGGYHLEPGTVFQSASPLAVIADIRTGQPEGLMVMRDQLAGIATDEYLNVPRNPSDWQANRGAPAYDRYGGILEKGTRLRVARIERRGDPIKRGRYVRHYLTVLDGPYEGRSLYIEGLGVHHNTSVLVPAPSAE